MNNLEEKRYWIWLSMIPNIGVRKKHKLLEIYKNPRNIFEASKTELENIKELGEVTISNILDMNIRKDIDVQIEKMQKEKVDIIILDDEQYPKMLREIYDYPVSLFVKGNIENLEKDSIGIVGCREATEYGKSAAKYFGYNLAKNNMNIVSGLAKGVDSYSHIGNICAQKEDKRSGKPIAIIGCGLDIIYPKENKRLEEEILSIGGTIVSEYILGTEPNKYNFPARNRIISGLSKGLLVIEAKRKSGTLITVDFALEQGREVFVIPGNINSINSIGTNDLIKQGAKVITCYEDILHNFYIKKI